MKQSPNRRPGQHFIPSRWLMLGQSCQASVMAEKVTGRAIFGASAVA
jgi:hypothetical protein